MRNVLFITPFPSKTMEYVRAAASLDEVRMLGIAKEVPGGGDAEVFADLVTVDNTDDPAQLVAAARVLESRHGRVRRVLGIRESLQVPNSGGYDGDGDIIVRNADTEVVTAAMKTIIETIGVEYG